ncbi:MAG: hypothetical protein HQK73_06035, partial [Desulfamplus sp.]|nr:hypothetical protein [Desulfamplus sp.]
MTQNFLKHLAEQTMQLRTEGLYKEERVIISQQQADIIVADNQKTDIQK